METQSLGPEFGNPPPVPPNATPPPGQPDSDQSTGSPQPNIVSSDKLGLLIWLFLLFMLASYAYRISRSDAYADFLEVPIQATSLMGGAELLGPGQWLSIARYGKGGTPSAEEWQMVGQVSAVSGNETEKKVVVLALPTRQAPTLQAALAVKDGPPLVYSLRDEPTVTPIPTATIPPTSTSTPFIAPLTSSGHVGLEIPTERIASGSAIAREGVLSLVIVPKVVTGSEDTVSSAPPLFNGCAAFVHFLDKNRHVTEKPDDAETVVVWLSASRLPEATAALTHAERVYLVPDVSCGPLQTPFPTPIHTPSPTPPSG